jgi:hypothetical protein
MNISVQELEALFYGEGTLPQVLPALKWELERSDYYDGIMIQRLTDNAEEAKAACNEITGLHGIIVKAYHFAEGALDVKEPQAAYRLRTEDESKSGGEKGKRKTDATISAEAAREVSQYRRVRSYLLGYVKGLDKSISTLQSILKYEGSPKGVSRPTATQQP